MTRGLFLLLASLAIPTPALAEENAVKEGARQFAADVKKAGREVGRTAKRVGKDIGNGTVKAGRTVKREFKEDFSDKKDNDATPRKRKVDRAGRS